MNSHILSTNDFKNADEILALVRQANEMVQFARDRTYTAKFPEKKGVLAFFEPSTRTHKSFKQAFLNLGLRIDEFSGAEGTSLMKKESLADTARMIAGQGADICVLRTTLEGGPRWIAEIVEKYGRNMCVINGGDGRNQHPTQTLLDLLTIKRKLGRLNNFRIGYLGDLGNGRTGTSLSRALSNFSGIETVLVSPKGAEMPNHAKVGLHIISESDSMDDLASCDVVYVQRSQLERIIDPILRKACQGQFIINKAVLDSWKKDVIVMHPLPSVEEIAPDIKSDPRLVAWEQAENGVPARMSLSVRSLMEPFFGLGDLVIDVDLLKNEKEIPVGDSQKPVRYFQPIKRGTVIDHIPPGEVVKLIHLLESTSCITGEHPRQLVQYVNSRKYEGQKDVLLLPEVTMDDIVAATAQFIYPEISINILPGNDMKIKKSFKTPSHIKNVFGCPNEDCITNNDPEANTIFIVNDRDNPTSPCRCHYCERVFNHESLVPHSAT
ncbi:MAG: aspartate carbamoyltransferase [Candidatus Kerfeldbacteria bacterium]